jgi:hypothetical protein
LQHLLIRVIAPKFTQAAQINRVKRIGAIVDKRHTETIDARLGRGDEA